MLAICFVLFFLSISRSSADHYDILGVHRGASMSDIRKQFRAKSRVLHPDVNTAPDAKERYADVLKAYAVLQDPVQRENYDRFGEAPHGAFRDPTRRWVISSMTRTLTPSEFVVEVRQYRGTRLRLVQIFSHSDRACVSFGPIWESLTDGALRTYVDMFRLDASEPLALELADLRLTELPSLFAYVDGHAHQFRRLRSGSIQKAVEEFAASFYISAIARVKSSSPSSAAEVATIIADSKFDRAVVLVDTEIPNADDVLRALLFLGDELRVVGMSRSLFTQLESACPGKSSWKTSFVWIHNSHSISVCDAARYPSSRVDKVESIAAFVEKRLKKRQPALTNSSFAALCATGCIADVRSRENMNLQALSDVVKSPTSMTIVSVSYHRVATLGIRTPDPSRWIMMRFTADDQYAVIDASATNVQSALAELIRMELTPLPGWWILPAEIIFESQVSMFHLATQLLEDVPFGSVWGLIAVWLLFKLIAALPKVLPQGRPTPDPASTTTNRQPASADRAASAPPPPREERDGCAKSESTVPGSSPASNTYPGASGNHDTRRTIPPLMSSDVTECPARTLLVLLFSVADGTKAPADSANLLRYPDVRIRVVRKRMVRWWSWLQEHAAQSLREAAAAHAPVAVAVRPRKGLAAIKSSDRSLRLWVDALLQGTETLRFSVDAAMLSKQDG